MKALCVIGTRPEAIKMAPAIRALREAGHEPTVCTTGQHNVRELLAHFRIDPQIELGRHGTTTIDLLIGVLRDLQWVLDNRPFDCILAQGDTTSVFAAANVAFLEKIPFVHVEAGLRTFDLAAPFPEECFRRCVSIAASLHCAPTARAANNLLDEGIDGNAIELTGQTGIDALRWTLEQIGYVAPNDYVLLTSHRLENRDRQQGIIDAAIEINKQHCVYYIEHPNPAARLDMPSEILRLEPRTYPHMAVLLAGCKAILTDSGGLQEEACYLGKPTVVLRDSTERPEAVEYGTAFVAGVECESILAALDTAFNEAEPFGKIVPDEPCPYGDGNAAEKIVQAMEAHCAAECH